MKDRTRYGIAPAGIFWSIQGEAHLCGFQMGFVRLAGCSVGCPGCDTDYTVAEKLTAEEIGVKCFQTFKKSRDQWVWLTGGEPTDHRLDQLLDHFALMGYRVALATSGVHPVIRPADWLSVSPHSADPAKFKQRYGNELKLADGLNGLDLEEWARRWEDEVDFFYPYVQPASVDVGCRRCASVMPCACGAGRLWRIDERSLERCMRFLHSRPHWGMSQQQHHTWRVS